MNELWKDIEGYEGLYQVSNLGRVKSLDREVCINGKTRHLNGMIMHGGHSGRGDFKVVLYKDGIGKSHLVHRLVAIAFLPNPNNYPQVNHKDENPYNNCVDNLEWCSVSYNINYGNHHRKMLDTRKSLNSPLSEKAVYQFSKEGEFVAEYISIMEAGRQTNIAQSSISNCCRNIKHTKSAGGYVWRFATEVSKEQLSNVPKGRETKVSQYTKEGIFVRCWDRMVDAEKELNIPKGNISKCCKGKAKTVGGYVWRYKEEKETA